MRNFILRNKQTLKYIGIAVIVLSLAFNIYFGVVKSLQRIYQNGVRDGQVSFQNSLIRQFTNRGKLQISVPTQDGVKTIILVPKNAQE